jgi:Ca2+-binding EF-hand superfamily protein
MAFKLTLDEINTYKDAFKLFENKEGKIYYEQLSMLMRSLGQNFSNQQLNDIIKNINANHDGFVEFHEFLELMSTLPKQHDDREKLIQAFKYFDRDNIGTIDYEEFEHVLTTVAEKLNEDEKRLLREKCEVERSGRLDYVKFIKLLLDN